MSDNETQHRYNLPQACIEQAMDVADIVVETNKWMQYYLFEEFRIGEEISKDQLEQHDKEWLSIIYHGHKEFNEMYKHHNLTREQMLYAQYMTLSANKNQLRTVIDNVKRELEEERARETLKK